MHIRLLLTSVVIKNKPGKQIRFIVGLKKIHIVSKLSFVLKANMPTIYILLVLLFSTYILSNTDATEIVQVSIGGFSLTPATSGLSMLKLNEYLYKDGETIDWTCGQQLQKDGTLRLRYYNRQGIIIAESQQYWPDHPLTFRQLMSAENNGSYIDCTYLPSIHEFQQEFTYRTNLTMKQDNSRNDNFIVTVNDTKLTSWPNSTSGVTKYQYKFVYGEMIIVTCEKNNKKATGDVKLMISTPHMRDFMKSNNLHNYTTDIEKTPRKYTFLIDTRFLDGTRYQCYTDENERFSSDISFHADFSQDPAVLGLPSGNVLYQYSKSDYQWEVHYQYTVNETLRLICTTTKNVKLQWVFKNETIPSDNVIRAHYGTRHIHREFTLNSEQNGTSITCEAIQKENITRRTFVILHQRPDEPLHFDQCTDCGLDVILIAGIVVGILVVVMVAVFAYCWHLRNRTVDNSSRPYKNFSESNSSTLAFPDHWQNNSNTYITYDDGIMTENSAYNGNGQVYAEPQKRITACSGHTENHYTEIDDYFINRNDIIETNYASPYEDHNIIQNGPSSSEPRDILQQDCDRLQTEYTNASYSNLLQIDRNKSFIKSRQSNDDEHYSNLQHNGGPINICKATQISNGAYNNVS